MCDLDCGQGVPSRERHGLEVAGDSAAGLGVPQSAELAGDPLPDLGHVDFAPGAVVGEGRVGFAGEAPLLACVRMGR